MGVVILGDLKNRSDSILDRTLVLDLICINFSSDSDNKRSVLDQNFGLNSGLLNSVCPGGYVLIRSPIMHVAHDTISFPHTPQGG